MRVPCSPSLVLAVALTLATACTGPASEPSPGPLSTPAGVARLEEHDSLSPSAQLATVAALEEDLAAPRHPSDGAGRAWLDPAEDGPVAVVARSPARFPVIFETGPLGIREGGAVFLMPSPFWGWSTPQTELPEAVGYTAVTTDAAGVRLEVATLDAYLLAIRIQGRDLAPGERLRIVYGAGPAGAVCDRYAERATTLWLAVDGDGDGVRAVLADSPRVDVLPGPAASLWLTLPTVARPGGPVRLTLAVLDAAGNAGVRLAGSLSLEAEPPWPGLPGRLILAPEAEGMAALELAAPPQGTFRVRAHGPDNLSGASNPMVVSEHGPRVLWGDLHGHSAISDGTATPEGYLRYARDVAGLDIAAITDHDHWGIRFLDQSPDLWQEIREQTEAFHEPGRFVTLLGYEWTSWLHGHRHVLYFDGEGAVLSSLDPRYDTPPELWAALRGRAALTVAHHSAGGPVATNWAFSPDPELEPVTEIVSVHGSSEAPDAPAAIYNPVTGNFARDVLDQGYRLGFIGSGDGHDGHPGLAHLGGPSGGLAAVVAEELTRPAVLEAMRARRVYASNGARILLRMSVAGNPMGSVVPIGPDGLEPAELVVMAVTTAPAERIDVIRSGSVVKSVAGDDLEELLLTTPLEGLRAGEYVYVRVIQSDGGAAWSSPVFFVAAPQDAPPPTTRPG